MNPKENYAAANTTWKSTTPPAVTYETPKEDRPLAHDREELVEHLVEETVNVLQDEVGANEHLRDLAKKLMESVATALEELGLVYGKDKKKPMTPVSKTPPSFKAEYYEKKKSKQLKYDSNEYRKNS